MHFMTISGSGLYLFGQSLGENSPASVSFFSTDKGLGLRECEPGLPLWPGRLTKSDLVILSTPSCGLFHPYGPWR